MAQRARIGQSWDQWTNDRTAASHVVVAFIVVTAAAADTSFIAASVVHFT